MKFYTTDSKAILTAINGTADSLKEIIANTTDAAVEKHVPVYEAKDGKICVKIGSAEHPMQDVHYIEWIALKTNKGFYVKYLSPGESPSACFAVENETVEAVYAYCNLHGLWKA